MVKTAFLYTEEYFAYDYGTHHPLRIERLRLTYDLCKAYGLFELPHADLIKTETASESDILRFHTPDYLDVLKQAGAGEISSALSHGIGPGDNPVFSGLWEWSRLHAGASLQCAQLVSEGKARIAFNIAGGLHHAHANRASGFCYVNDPVLAILRFVDQGKRVMYVDVDAHHGDGVQWTFYEDPRVLTVSFHQDGRSLFPGTGRLDEIGRGQGRGYAVNVPMLPGSDDHVFWEGFRRLVPRLMEGFKPDVVVSQLGVDAFQDDPLAALELTTNGFCRAISYLAEQAPAWVALGGGGYSVPNVARAWTLAWAMMNGVDLPDDLPEAMARPLSTGAHQKLKLRDADHKSPWRDQCLQRMEECIGYLEAHVLSRVV
ncbi:MAG: acetoin utilization protein AcuC [Thermodesulfobacteriota bacterium]|nr:acetoin utilization protein AcuC [Thermodesulfobacteriota bacterium]